MFGDVRQVEVEDERDRRIVTVVLEDEVDEQLVSKLSDLDDVIAVRWRT
jgi:acetolactate synthase small subunit